MRNAQRFCIFVAVCLMVASQAGGQEREDRTLLSWEAMRAIINETSGERAMHHVLELVPYPRVRTRTEYETTFRETDVIVRYAKDYGFSNVEVESFPSRGELWQPTQGELWMIEPERRKLCDIYDVAVSLAGNSESGDVTAELVDVGGGDRPGDYAGKDLTGKIVLGSGRTSSLQRNGIFEGGAVGVLSYNSIRPVSYPDQVLSQSISSNAPEGKSPGFGWSIAPRLGQELSSMLARGQKVVLRSIVKAETFPGELEVVHATIPGDGTTDQAIAVSAHLYEGYIKQGANDDGSGCALILEMGRAYMKLVQEGALPPPKRTIHFLWVPEISGTNAWLEKHEDIAKQMIADLNFDMEGVRLSANASFWVMHRTPDTSPTYLNDVGQSVMEFVAELNRERVRYRSSSYGFSLPVISPNGSLDPFYIKVDKHYGASDHVIYLQHDIPALMFITWPDMYYHSSQDVPDILDPTQFKRAGVVGIGAMSVLASADDAMALKIAAESMARGAERMGASQRKGLSYLVDAESASVLPEMYKEARNAVRHQAEIEKAVVRSAATLFADPAAATKRLSALESLIGDRSDALLDEVKAVYRLEAQQRNVSAQEAKTTALEKEAAKLYPERVGEGRWWGRGGYDKLSEAELASLAKVPQHMSSELNILFGHNKSVLEIRDFLAGEFEPLPLSDLMDYLKVMEKLERVKLVKK
jgi:aminopeptidase YwaD